MVVGILLVLMAAVFSGAGSVLEAQGAQVAGHTLTGEKVGFGRLIRQPRYVIGLVIDVLGFLAAAAAMQYLPLFMVQAGVASSVGVTALLAAVLGTRLPRRSVAALCGMTLGLVLLAASASPEPPISLSTPWKWTLLGAALPTALVAWAGLRLSGRSRSAPPSGSAGQRSATEPPATADPRGCQRLTPRTGPTLLLALAAGLAFTWVAVAARVLDTPPGLSALIDPVVLAILVNGALGTAAFAAALEHGSVVLVSTVNYVTETVLPSAIGLAFLGDRVRDGFGAVAGLGFVLAVGCALLLADHSASLPTPGRSMVPTRVQQATG